MEEVTLQDIVDTARGIDTKRFVAGVDDFIKASARLDALAGDMTDDRREALLRRQDESHDTILLEAGKILTQSTLSISFIINFRFQLNGHAGKIPSLDDSTLYYFRKMRKHQIELLMSIGNEISMIRDTLRHSRRMEAVFQRNAPPVAQAARFMSVVRERIEARPTTLLKLNGSSRKIEQLNHTFKEIQSYEDDYHQKIQEQAEANPIRSAMEICADLTLGALRDMEDRRNRLKADIKELEKGRKFMIRLATDGYSPFMKKHLDRLVASHLERSRGFSTAVREWRKIYYIEEPN